MAPLQEVVVVRLLKQVTTLVSIQSSVIEMFVIPGQSYNWLNFSVTVFQFLFVCNLVLLYDPSSTMFTVQGKRG